MKEIVNLALIGAGLWGKKHLEIYKKHPRANVVAICDLNEERAKVLAKQHSISHSYGDVKTMFKKHPEIDGVSIVTPDHLHRAPALEALQAGKHILIEKPLASTLEDAEAIVKAAESSGCKLMVEFNSRWALPFFHLKQAFSQGEIGTPIHGFARYSNKISVPTEMLSWAGHSSVLLFVGCLIIDVARWILEDEVKRVYAVSRKKVLCNKGINTPDFFQSILEFQKGTVLVLENSWVLPKGTPVNSDIKFELVGTKGGYKLDLKQHGAITKYTSDGIDYPEIFAFGNIMDEEVGSVDRCIKSFVDCIISDSEPIVNGYDGLAVNRVIDAIYKSINNGKPIDIQE